MDHQPARLRCANELAAIDLPPRELLLDPLISTQTLALLYGPRGLGKTFVALGIAWAAASGGSFLGWRGSGGCRVVYLDGEMAALDIQKGASKASSTGLRELRMTRKKIDRRGASFGTPGPPLTSRSSSPVSLTLMAFAVA